MNNTFQPKFNNVKSPGKRTSFYKKWGIFVFPLLLILVGATLAGCYLPSSDLAEPKNTTAPAGGSVKYYSGGVMSQNPLAPTGYPPTVAIMVPESFVNPITGEVYGRFQKEWGASYDVVADLSITNESTVNLLEEGADLPPLDLDTKWFKFIVSPEAVTLTYANNDPATMTLTLPDVGTFEGTYTLKWYFGNANTYPNGVTFYWGGDSPPGITTIEVVGPPGSIKGDISLDPSRSVSVEVTASQNGIVRGRTVIIGSGQYLIEYLPAGHYSVEAHAPGYEIDIYDGEVSVEAGVTEEGVNIDLAAAWPMFKQDKWNTGKSHDDILDPPLVVGWAFVTGGSIESSPVVSGGRVFVGSIDGRVYGVSLESGEFLWSYSIGSEIRVAPSVAYHKVFVSARDGKVYAFGEDDGQFKWSYSATGGNYYIGSPVIADGRLFVGTQGQQVHAVNVNTGQVEWDYVVGQSIYSSFAVANGSVFVPAGGSVWIYSLDANYGIQLWERWIGNTSSSPSVVNGSVYIGVSNYSGSPRIFSLDEKTGDFNWNYSPVAPIRSSPSVSGGRVFVGSDDGRVYSLSESSGSLVWSYSTGGGVESSPAVANGKVFVGSDDGKIYAFDESTGAVEWTYDIGSPIKSSPAISDGKLLIGAGDNVLYAFETPFPGDISGTITLNPDADITLEVEAFKHGVTKDRVVLSGPSPYAYVFSDLTIGEHLVEIHAPGYEIKSWIITVESDVTVEAVHQLDEAWPMYGQDRWHTGASPLTNYSVPLLPLFEFQTGAAIESEPAIMPDGTIYFGSNDNRLYVLNADGSFKWSFLTGDDVKTTPAIYDGIVYFGSNDNKLYAVSQDSGAFNWSYNSVVFDVKSSPVISGGNIFGVYGNAVGAGSTFSLVNDGTLLWSYPVGGLYSPVIANGKVYSLIAGGSRVLAIDQSSGGLQWSVFTTGGAGGSLSVGHGSVYVASGLDRFYGYDLENGSGTFSYLGGSPIGYRSTPAISKANIIAGKGTSLQSLSSSTQTPVWTFPTSSTAESPAVANEIVFFGTTTGEAIIAVRETDGAFLWSYDIGSEIYSSPALFGGNVYIGAGDGKLYAFTSPGSIKTSLSLDPEPSTSVSVEVVVYQSGVIEKAADFVYDGPAPEEYDLGIFLAGAYSIEAHVPGYELKPGVVNVIAGTTVEADITLNAAWPMFKQDKWRTGSSPHLGPNPPHFLMWSYYTGSLSNNIYASPAIVNGSAYVANGINLYAFTELGVLKWSYRAGGNSSPTVSNGTIYIGGSYAGVAKLFALEDVGSSAQLKWSSLQLSSSIFTSPLVSNGRVYLGAGSKLFAFGEDSEFKWSYQAGAFIYSSPSISEGVLYFGSGDRRLHAIRDVGTSYGFEWSYFVVGAPLGFYHSSPLISNGKIYIGSWDSRLHAVNEETGGFEWSFISGDFISSSPSVYDGTVYFGSNDFKLYAFEENGTFKWSYWTNLSINSSPMISNGIIYIGSQDNAFYAIRDDIDHGELVWSYNTDDSVRSSPSMLNGAIYVGSNDGSLYVFSSPGSISGEVTLNPEPSVPVSVEVSVSYDGEMMGNTLISYVSPGPESYFIHGLNPGVYSVEAHAPGYEIKPFTGGGVRVLPDATSEASFTLASAWPMFKQDRWHTGSSPHTGPDLPLILKWSYSASGTTFSNPLVYDGKLYFGTNGLKLYSVSAESGELLWSIDTAGGVFSAPVIYGGILYGTSGQRIYAKDLSDPSPSLLWSIGLSGFSYSSAVVANGMMYVCTSGGNESLNAVSIDGTVKWSYSLVGGSLSSPTVSDGVIYVGASNGNLYAINEDGTLKWFYATADNIYSSPVISDGVIYVGSNKLYAIEDGVTQGNLLWSAPIGTVVLSSPSIVGDTIYVGSTDFNLYAVRTDGEIKWSAPTEGQIYSSSPLLSDGLIYVGSNDTSLYAFKDNETWGELMWSYKTEGWIYSSPSVFGETVYVGSNDTNIYAFSTAASISGEVTLSPEPSVPVTVEVVAYQDGLFKAKSSVYYTPSGPHSYLIEGLYAGTYSLEASAPGYEIKPYSGGGIAVAESQAVTGKDFTLNAAWPMFKQDRWNTGNSPHAGPTPPLTLLWSFNAWESLAFTAPIVSNGVVFFGSADDMLYAVRADGTLKWSFDTLGNNFWSPAVYNGNVYVGSYSGNLYSIDEETGTENWNIATAGQIWTSPSISNGIIYIGSNSGRFFAVGEDGMLKWSFPTAGTIGDVNTSAVISDGVIYFGARDSKIYALNDDGSFRWSFAVGGDVFYSSPTISDGVIYFGSVNEKLYALEDKVTHGELRWSLGSFGQINSSPSVSGDIIYFGSRGDSNLYAVEDKTTHGEVNWSYGTGGRIFSSPTISDGYIYIGSRDSKLHAIKDQGGFGEEVWNYTAGNFVDSSPAIYNEILYVGSDDGNLYAFGTAIAATLTIEVSGVEVGLVGGIDVTRNGELVHHATFEVQSGTEIVEISPIFVDSYLVEASVPGYISSNEAISIDNLGTGATVYLDLTPGWTSFHQDRTNTGAYPHNSIGPNLTPSMRFDAGGDEVLSSPVASGGDVYIGSENGQLYSLDELNFSVNWSHAPFGATPANIVVSPILDDASVYAFASSTGTSRTLVSSINRSNGGLQWSYLSPLIGYDVPPGVSPVKGNELIYFGVRSTFADSYVVLLDATDGSEMWSFVLEDDPTSSFALNEGRVYVGDAAGVVYAIENVSGAPELMWSYDTGAGAVRGSPAVADGKVFVGSDSNYLLALNETDGSFAWSKSAGNNVQSTPVLYNGNVYVTAGDGTVRGYQQSDGAVLFNESVAGVAGNLSPVVANNRLYVPASDRIVILNLLEGTIEATSSILPSGAGFSSNSPAIFNGKFYMGANDNYLYAFEANLPVDAPFDLSQFRIDGLTAIADLGWTSERTVEVKFHLTDQNNYDTLSPEASVLSNLGVTSAFFGSEVQYDYEIGVATGEVALINLDDGFYTWEAVVTDSGGSVSREGELRFGIDLVIPQSNVITPPNGNYLNFLDSITGEAWDSGFSSGLHSVEVSVKKVGTDEFWSATLTDFTYSSQAIYNLATGLAAWSLGVDNDDWETGGSYEVWSRAKDLAGNYEIPLTANVFTFDASAPELTLISPEAGSYWRSATPADSSENLIVRWIATDEVGGLAENPITIYISTGEGATLVIYANEPNVGIFEWLIPPFINSSSAVVTLEAVDKLGNIATVESGYFNLDATSPDGIIITPVGTFSAAGISDYIYSDVNSITGEASDVGSGVATVEIWIRNVGIPSGYWNGSSWVGPLTWLNVSGTGSWNFDASTVDWSSAPSPEGYFVVASMIADNVGHTGTNLTMFDVDWTSPESWVVTPEVDGYYNSLASLSGTAEANGPSGLSSVEVSIKMVSLEVYWDGGSWGGETWLSTSGTTNWSKSSGLPTWQDNTSYEVRSRAWNDVGNVENPKPGNIFVFDSITPVATVEFPVDNAVYVPFSTLSGTAFDDGGSGVAGVKVAIINKDSGLYWDGSFFSSTDLLSHEASWTTSWSYFNLNLLTEFVDGYYQVGAAAYDVAGNLQPTLEADVNDFYIDTGGPTVLIITPSAEGYYNSVTSITGEASDTYSDIATVEIAVKRVSDGNYWDGGGWGVPEVWLAAAGSNEWSYVQPISWGNQFNYNTFEVFAHAADEIGNISTSEISFTYDVTLPNVVTSEPVSGEAYVRTDKNIVLYFTEPIDPDGPVIGSVTPTIVFEGLLWESDDKLIVQHQGFGQWTTYEAILNNVVDLAGNDLETDYFFTFTTTGEDIWPPYVVSTDPISWETNVFPDISVEVVFSETMSRDATERSFTTMPDISGTFSWYAADQRMTFTPDSLLDYLVTYEVTISTTAEDKSGVSLAQDFVWQFTTEPSAPAAPILTATAESTTQILWEWNDVLYEDGYRLIIDGSAITTTEVSYEASGFSPNTAYVGTLETFNHAGVTTSDAVTRYTWASVPTNLDSTDISAFDISLTWEGDGTRYALERATDEAGSPINWQFVFGSNFGTATTELYYTDSGLNSGTTYWYRASAYNGDGIITGPSTPAASFETVGVPLVPAVFLGVASGTSEITWSWTESATYPDIDYYVLISADGTSLITTTETIATEEALASNVRYERFIRVTNEAGYDDTETDSVYTWALVPSNLIVPSISAFSITLTWEGNGTSYQIERRVGDDLTWVSAGSTTEATLLDLNLSAGADYYYHLRALNGDGVPTAWYPDDVVGAGPFTTTATPETPLNFGGTVMGTGEINWYWDNVLDEFGYYLVSFESGLIVGSAEADVIATIEALLAPNTIYTRAVRSWSDAGVSSNSNSDSVCTWAQTPTNVTSPAHSASSISLNWIGDGSSYEVIRADDNAGVPADTWISSGRSPISQFLDGGLSAGTVYWYKVYSFNQQNVVNPVSSEAVSAETTGIPVPPASGFSLEGVAQSTSEILWSWSTVEVTDYYQLVSAEGHEILDQIYPPLQSTLEVGLMPNTVYSRYARACNDAGCVTSETDSVYTLATIPYNLFISSPLPYTALLTWESDATTFEVQVAVTSEAPVESQWTQYYGSTDEAAFVDSGLLPGTQYWYRAIGYNGDGITTEPSVPISIISIEGTTGTPEAPSYFVGTAESMTSIRWSWDDRSLSEWGYYLRDGVSDTIVATLAADSTFEVETGLSTNSAYSRYVEVFSATFNVTSESDMTYTFARVPEGLTSPTQELYAIGLTWEGFNATGFIVERLNPGLITFESAGVTTEPTFFDSPLGPALTYVYRVRAYNGDGISTEPSATVEASTLGTIDSTPPVISDVRFGGNLHFSGDVIPPKPYITAVITDETEVTSIRIKANTLTIYQNWSSTNWNDSTNHGTAEYEYGTTGSFEYTLTEVSLSSPPVLYTIYIRAEDSSGNSTEEAFDVRIYAGAVQVIGPALAYPVPFMPLTMLNTGGDPLRIAYTLTDDADIIFYVYDLNQRTLYTRKFFAGQNGGRAGYNQLEWNGVTDFGHVLGNGIYIYQILRREDRKPIGKGKIVIFE
jgi:outer membrane protein assembly factor BamB